VIDVEKLDPVDPRFVEQFDIFRRNFVARLDVDLAVLSLMRSSAE
jgi:hypothetical protein